MVEATATIVTNMPTSRIATHGAGEGPIFGRERELAQLYELVDEVPERGAALLVRGEPGIGKSTLLAAACRHAEDVGMRMLCTTGVQSEAQLPFVGLHQLVLPVLDQADRLPTPQRTALLAAFAWRKSRVRVSSGLLSFSFNLQVKRQEQEIGLDILRPLCSNPTGQNPTRKGRGPTSLACPRRREECHQLPRPKVVKAGPAAAQHTFCPFFE